MAQNTDKRRSNITLAVILGLIALAFYVGFIYMTSTAG